jgi:Na+/H+-dicarboxylate symporter
MDASALYQGLATLFVAQLYGIDLSVSALVVLLLTVVGASIGTPATPGVGIIILSSVLKSAGVPLEGLTLIIGIDRILELFRASLNVTGDLVCCAVMDRWVPVTVSKDEELRLQEERDDIRERTGEDTLVLEPGQI